MRLPRNLNPTTVQLAGAMAFFPLVGGLLGGGLALLGWLGSYFLTPPVVAVALLVALVLVTGNLHWDGWMDTADGLLGGNSRERALEIMKDSRVGAHGVVAGCLGLLLEYILLSNLLSGEGKQAGMWLVAILTVSRWAGTCGAVLFPYARTGQGTGKVFVEAVSARELAMATVIAVFIGFWSIGCKILLLLAAVLGVTLVIGLFAWYKIRGVTGDILGAVIIASEIAGLLIATAGDGWVR